MELTEKTYMKKHMIKNVYNNLQRLDLNSEDGFDDGLISDIKADLKYAYENNEENYLMNLTYTRAVTELVAISKDYELLGEY